MNWKKDFTKKTLEDGLKCFCEDKVHDIYVSSIRITSIVDESSNNEYKVEIIYDDKDIISATCTCPDFHPEDYEYSGNHCCKHIVATLYVFDKIVEDTLVNLGYNSPDSMDEITDAMTNLSLIRANDDNVMDYERDAIIDSIDKSKIDKLKEFFEEQKQILNNILDHNVKKSENDTPYTGDAPVNIVLHMFIKDIIIRLNREYAYECSKELMFIIYEKLAMMEDAREYFDVENILLICNLHIGDIIDFYENDKRDEIYNRFMKIIKDNYESITASYILSLCSSNYTYKRYKVHTLDVINNIIRREDDVDEGLYELKRTLMKKLKYSDKDILLEFFDYDKYTKISIMLFEYNIREDDYDTIIKVLEEKSKTLNDIDLLENTLFLIDFYTITGDKEKCIGKLEQLLFDFGVCDIIYIAYLREVCTKKQWEKELKSLIEYYKRENNYDFINQIYVYDNRFEELYNNIIDNCQLETLDKYRPYYEDEHGDDILNIYKEVILEKQQTAKNKKAYNTIIEYLNMMLKYDNSEEIVQDLVDTIKNNKKNKGKKVFMEELRKFEYTIKN